MPGLGFVLRIKHYIIVVLILFTFVAGGYFLHYKDPGKIMFFNINNVCFFFISITKQGIQ